MDYYSMTATAQIISILRRTYKKGLISSGFGSLSLRDSSGNIWITPANSDNGRLEECDIMMRDTDGSIYGKHELPADAEAHFEIYRRRGDIGGIIFADPPRIIGQALSGSLPDTMIFPQCEMRCGTVVGIPFDGRTDDPSFVFRLGDTFDDGVSTVVCGTRGVFVAEKNLLDSFMALETIDLVASVSESAMILGTEPRIISAEHLAQYKLSVSLPLMEDLNREVLPNEKEMRSVMCEYINRAYEAELFLDGNGALSVRLGKDAFLITPSDKERDGIRPDDLVLIHRGKKEADSHPSNSAALHRRIYLENPYVKAVMIGHPKHTMAFGATSLLPEQRFHPEWSRAIGNLRLLPFGATVMQPGMFAEEITENDLAYIVENDCVICMGGSLEETFAWSEAVEKCAAAAITARILRGRS